MAWSGGTYTRTDGTRTGTTVWQQAKAAGVNIVATDHDTHDQDIATGINTCLTKDGQNSPTANLPMGGYRHTGVDDAAARDDYAAAGQVQDGAFIWGGTAAGTADALTIAPSPAITAYAAGQTFRFKTGAGDNTGAATININGAGAKAIQNDGSALAAGDLPASTIVSVIYDGTQFQLLSRGIDYGATGTKQDVIAESTAAAGVTVDSVVCKDGGVTLANGSTALDHYEEGTWTPVMRYGGGPALTLGTALGWYTVIGDVVHFGADIAITTETGSGAATISLPFTASSGGSNNAEGHGVIAFYSSLVGLTGAPVARIALGATVMNVAQTASSGTGNLDQSHFQSGSQFRITGMYRKA